MPDGRKETTAAGNFELAETPSLLHDSRPALHVFTPSVLQRFRCLLFEALSIRHYHSSMMSYIHRNLFDLLRKVSHGQSSTDVAFVLRESFKNHIDLS